MSKRRKSAAFVTVGAVSMTASSLVGVAAGQDAEVRDDMPLAAPPLQLPTVATPVPAGFESATAAEARLADIGWSAEDLSELESQVADAMNQEHAEKYAEIAADGVSVPADRGQLAVSDLSSYYFAQDDGSFGILTAPAGHLVDKDGLVHIPDVNEENSELSAPTWSGDWGNLSSWDHTWNYYDSPSWAEQPDCSGQMHAQLRVRVYRKKLSVGGSKDYWGFEQQWVAEIISGSGGFSCNNFIDTARSHFKHSNSSSEWFLQKPSQLPGTNCQTTSVNLGVTVGQATGSISQDFERCENWDVDGYLASSGTTKYQIDFENNGSCSGEDRVGAMTWVTEVPDGTSIAGSYGGHVDPDQEPGNCCANCNG